MTAKHAFQLLALLLLLAAGGLPLAQDKPAVAATLRIATSITEQQGDAELVRRFVYGLERLSGSKIELVVQREGSYPDRVKRIIRDLRDDKADVAIVPMSAISDKPFYSYSLLPFLLKDKAGARQHDLAVREAFMRRMREDFSIRVLGTLPRLPRIFVSSKSEWDGALNNARVYTTTKFEAEEFARIDVRGAMPMDRPMQGLAPGDFAALPLDRGLEMIRKSSSMALYLYDVRASFPTMAVLTASAASGSPPPARQEQLAALVSALEASAWQNLDQVTDEILEKAEQTGIKAGILGKEFGKNYSELIRRSLSVNARRSVSEDNQVAVMRVQERLNKTDQKQRHGSKCTRLNILLVTNRKLPKSAPFRSGELLQRQVRELPPVLGSQVLYGIAEVQVSATDVDRGDIVGDCTDASGKITADKGFRLHRVRLYSRGDFEQAAGKILTDYGAGASFLFFVHGFNVNAMRAIETAANLSQRTDHGLIPVLFSWPSAGSEWYYKQDGELAAKSVPALHEALSVMQAMDPKRRIQFVAHSMGNRITLAALESAKAPQLRSLSIEELVNVAPDVSCKQYAQTMPKILGQNTASGKLVNRATLYLYDKDSALLASNIYHFPQGDERCRIGRERGRTAPPMADVEIVDWSCSREVVDAHSYYVQSDYISGDLRGIVAEHKPPSRRRLNRIVVGATGASYFLHTGIKNPNKCPP